MAGSGFLLQPRKQTRRSATSRGGSQLGSGIVEVCQGLCLSHSKTKFFAQSLLLRELIEKLFSVPCLGFELGLMIARQVLYRLSHTPRSPTAFFFFALVIFGMGS
jgi:hypothetical protein